MNFSRRLKWRAAALAALVFAADRASKAMVEAWLDLNQPWPVLGEHLHFTHARNRGIVWGIMNNADNPLSGWPIAVFSGLVLAALVVYFVTVPATKRLLHVSLALVIGGAAGNLWDRVVRGFVTDFIEADLGFMRWPTFNVADLAISVGVGLMALDILFGDDPEPVPPAQRAGAGSGP